MKISKLKTPNTYVIIFSLIALVALSTWFIPGGKYDMTIIDGRELILSDSFHYVQSNPQGIGDVLMAPINGFVDAALIIGFVLLVGGAFGVLQKTEAIDALIKSITKTYMKSPLVRALLIPLLMTIFSFMGAVFGFSEEVIPFVLIFIPLSLMIGYDTVTGVAIPFVGAGMGFAAAFLNPFTIGIAQGIAGLPPFSGIFYRIVTWVITTATGIFYVMAYARKIKKNPSLSMTFQHDIEKKKSLHIDDLDSFSGMDRKHIIVLMIFLFSIISLITGVLAYDWYIEEISGLFIVTGILVGVFGGLKSDEITRSFLAGAKDLTSTAIIIGLARGILIIAKEGLIIDTMLNYMSSLIGGLHPVFSAQVMFIVQTFINFFVPSGSGQAALTMPVMAPLADIVGVSRQTAVLAFQFGDGFSNMIIPTSAVTMGVLTLADIPWEKWAKWILPLEIILLFLGCALLVPPVLMGWH